MQPGVDTRPATSGYADILDCTSKNPDGKRFLMIKPPETTDEESTTEESATETPHKINIVLSWLEELKQRVSVP